MNHIQELRRRIMWILFVFVISIVGGLICAGPFIKLLKTLPPTNQISWQVFSPWDALRIYMNFGLLIALMFTLPVILYHLWAFMKPGLRDIERKAIILYIPSVFFLFILGVAFGYFVVFPFAFYFTSMISQSLEINELYGVSQYFSFMFNIVIPISILFELPVVVMFLTKIRILNPRLLRKFRRFAYFILVVLSTIITPPDAISAIIVAIPLLLLYEVSVLLSSAIYRKQQKQHQQDGQSS
jgi:sec-independent protein translocase protein TatC